MMGRRGFLLGLVAAPALARAAQRPMPQFATGGTVSVGPIRIGESQAEYFIPRARVVDLRAKLPSSVKQVTVHFRPDSVFEPIV